MDKKTITIVVLAVLLAALLAGGGVYLWQKDDGAEEDNSTQETVEVSTQEDEFPTEDAADTDGDEEEIATEEGPTQTENQQLIFQALADHLSSDLSDLVVNFDETTATHASGSVNFVGSDVGGGYWFAALDNGTWVIAADGNGVIMCDDIDPYNFPTSMIAECWDGTTTVTR